MFVCAVQYINKYHMFEERMISWMDKNQLANDRARTVDAMVSVSKGKSKKSASRHSESADRHTMRRVCITRLFDYCLLAATHCCCVPQLWKVIIVECVHNKSRLVDGFQRLFVHEPARRAGAAHCRRGQEGQEGEV